MSVAASEQFPLFVLDKFGLGRIPTGAAEFSPFGPSGQGQRTSSADRARHGEGRTKQQELSPHGPPSNGRADDEDPGQQKSTRGAPPGKARKRHAIKPATALDNHEDPGENDAGKKAPNHAAAQVTPIPSAARMRRPHFFMTPSRRSIGPAFHMMTTDCQVLCSTEYVSGKRRSRAPGTECDEACA
jgi:hypothetical protein